MSAGPFQPKPPTRRAHTPATRSIGTPANHIAFARLEGEPARPKKRKRAAAGATQPTQPSPFLPTGNASADASLGEVDG